MKGGEFFNDSKHDIRNLGKFLFKNIMTRYIRNNCISIHYTVSLLFFPDDFGISVPPLVDYLRTILREYSDGQIIKVNHSLRFLVIMQFTE